MKNTKDVKRIPIQELPKSEEELKQWCFRRFQEKDDLLTYFEKNQKFPGSKDSFEGAGYYYYFIFIIVICNFLSNNNVILLLYLF